VNAFALKGRITLLSTTAVIQSTDQAVKFLVDLYMGPRRTPEEMRAMMDIQSEDAIGDFARVCRAELQTLR
jgi:hypothetical protein